MLGYDFRDSPHLRGVLDSPRQLHDRVFNFELLDIESGLFAVAAGDYYAALHFGVATFREGNLSIDVMGSSNKAGRRPTKASR